jgi:hypothetical protein
MAGLSIQCPERFDASWDAPVTPNGLRYWLAGGMYFANENQKFAPIYFRTRALPANPVHALLACFLIAKTVFQQ